MPTEIRIVTTELGAEMARRSFFGEGNILDAFWRDYGLSPAAFTEADIHAILPPLTANPSPTSARSTTQQPRRRPHRRASCASAA
ncbi:MAG: hypothetical protein ACLUNV_05715 [Sutterella wadsworthensis]